MASTSFDEFVRRENQAAQASDREHLDWQARKEYWLDQLNQLFVHIREYLAPYVAQGQVRIEEQTVRLNEESVGAYSAREMLITIGTKTVRVVPVGANVLLARGRVDIEGPLARALLLLYDSDSPFMHEQKDQYLPWRILTPPPFHPVDPKRYMELIYKNSARSKDIELVDRDRFLNLLQDVANG